LAGCEPIGRPVQVVIVAPGQMQVLPTRHIIFLVIAKDLLEGKTIKNTMTEKDLEECLSTTTVEKVENENNPIR
jgi:hypothetical protein